MIHQKLSYDIQGCLYEVYNELGPGLLESVYARALQKELRDNNIQFQHEVFVDVYYKNELLGNGFRADFIVEDKIIIELKSVEELKKVHFKQLRTYLKLQNMELGYLVNFNEVDFKKGIHRIMR